MRARRSSRKTSSSRTSSGARTGGPASCPSREASPRVSGDDADGEPLESLRRALVLGIRDYAGKCGFRSAVLGLSGGIDSALVAALAVDALGKENVTGLGMPSPYSSEGSVSDARALAENLGIRFEVLPIGGVFEDAKAALAPVFRGRPEDVTEENLQARVRGLLVMGFSNKFGSLVLSTGNKSELAVGYCTLYGDMCGGLAPISDLPKMRVYALARHLNARAGRLVIPGRVPHEAAVRRAPARPDGPGLAPALPGPRRDPREPRRTQPHGRAGRAAERRAAARRREDRTTARRLRVQAAAGRTRPQGLREGVRDRAARPDRAEVAALMDDAPLESPRYPWKEIPGSSHDVLLRRILARPAGLSVLDLGFGAGQLARRIRDHCRYLAGIELDPEAARAGAPFFDELVAGELLEGLAGPWREPFDVVVAGDILEHLPRPERLLELLKPLFARDGVLMLSLPNVANVTVRASLAAGRFAYADRGILDRTHLRFYTRASARALLAGAGYRTSFEAATAMPVELAVPSLGRPPLAAPVRGAARLLAAAWPTLFGYQFVFEAIPA